jgi:hypothetical protein
MFFFSTLKILGSGRFHHIKSRFAYLKVLVTSPSTKLLSLCLYEKQNLIFHDVHIGIIGGLPSTWNSKCTVPRHINLVHFVQV